MNITFTLEQMLNTFANYNNTIFPLQIFVYLLGIVALLFVIKQKEYSSRIIFGILAFLWLWTGIVFFMQYFGPIYKPAYGFGGLFIIQGIIYLVSYFKSQVSFNYNKDVFSLVGIIFIVYAMVGYPLFGYFINHTYPQMPPFGLTPCPLVVFTFGLLLLTNTKVPKSLFVIPFLWSVSGFIPVYIGIWEDGGLIIAGILGTIMIIRRDKKF
jgi:hypothetical protein